MADVIYYVGTEEEVLRHAAPLMAAMPNVEIADPGQVRERAVPGDVALLYSEHFDRFRDLCVELKSRRVPTIYAVDGILEWRNAWENRVDEIACPWTMRPCLSDVVAATGSSQCRVLESWGNGGRVYNVGIPRLDFWNGRQDRPSLGTSDRFDILVATARCPGFTPQQLETTGRSVSSVAESLGEYRLPDGRSVKLHWRVTGELEKVLNLRNDGRALEELLPEMDAVITLPSTLLLESMLAGCPTILLDFHRCPQYVPTVWTINHPEQIRSTIEEIARLPMDSPKRSLQQFLLEDSLSCDGRSTERLVKLITATQQRATECRSAGDWAFENLDWPWAPTTRSHAIEASPKANDTDETGMSPVQWQRYAEQLQRENQRLNRLLQEAHQVFDHMQGHPVLGSLLKTHKWVSERVLRKSSQLSKPPEMEERD